MLLKQKVVLISREVIERARQRDEQTEVLTEVRTRFQGPQYVLPLTMALLTSYTVNARYAEPAFGRLTTRAMRDLKVVIYHIMESMNQRRGRAICVSPAALLFSLKACFH